MGPKVAGRYHCPLSDTTIKSISREFRPAPFRLFGCYLYLRDNYIIYIVYIHYYLIVSHFVIDTLGSHNILILKVVLCTWFTDPRFLAFIHIGPFYVFVRFAVHLLTCNFVTVSNQIKDQHSAHINAQDYYYL